MYYAERFASARWLVLLLTLVLAACGGGGSSSTGTTPPQGATNALAVHVDSGLTGDRVNQLYASVTVCRPGTSICQTIDHVLVDTGSTGLRLLSSALAPSLGLAPMVTTGGRPLLGCVQFVDNSYVWGPLARADLMLAGKTALNVPIHIVGDSAYAEAGAACTPGGTAASTNIDNVSALGANGILGLSQYIEDCGSMCASVVNNGFYFVCNNAACTSANATALSTSSQIQNPVALFATDNNGLVVDLPAVPAHGQSSTSGWVLFGIGTQSDNQPIGAPSVLTSRNGYIATRFGGDTMPLSFIDTGSNGLFFNQGGLAHCTNPGLDGFYCPDTLTNLNATIVGSNNVNASINFAVDDARRLVSAPPRAALPTLAGPLVGTYAFDWGLPFFYGRRVYLGLEGRASALGTNYYFAF